MKSELQNGKTKITLTVELAKEIGRIEQTSRELKNQIYDMTAVGKVGYLQVAISFESFTTPIFPLMCILLAMMPIRLFGKHTEY